MPSNSCLSLLSQESIFARMVAIYPDIYSDVPKSQCAYTADFCRQDKMVFIFSSNIPVLISEYYTLVCSRPSIFLLLFIVRFCCLLSQGLSVQPRLAPDSQVSCYTPPADYTIFFSTRFKSTAFLVLYIFILTHINPPQTIHVTDPYLHTALIPPAQTLPHRYSPSQLTWFSQTRSQESQLASKLLCKENFELPIFLPPPPHAGIKGMDHLICGAGNQNQGFVHAN